MDNAVIRGNDDHDSPSPHFVPEIPKTTAYYLGDSRNSHGAVLFSVLLAVNMENAFYLVRF